MSGSTASTESELRELLGHVGPLHEQAVSIPGANRIIRVVRPMSIDQLLELAESDPEQHLPYWAELWPSGIALASFLITHPDLVRNQRTIELGSGLGITAAIASSLGAKLIATDYAAESLTLTRLTCLLNGEAEPVTVRFNWRDTSDPLLDGSQTFPVILAADVLYERRDIEPLLALFDRLLAPGGVVLLAEPGREPARLFLDHADTQGWQREIFRIDGPWPDPKDEAVVVRIHRLSRVSVPSNP